MLGSSTNLKGVRTSTRQLSASRVDNRTPESGRFAGGARYPARYRALERAETRG